MRLVFDIESTGLLDDSTVDYTASPFKLKPGYKVHCIVAQDLDSGVVYEFVGGDCKNFVTELLPRVTELVGHNILGFDLLALKSVYGLQYTVAGPTSNLSSTICGNPCKIVDTLVVSKTLKPDRFGGHSLDEWGQRLGKNKIDWRKRAVELGLIQPTDERGAEFKTYHQEMLVYCKRDVEVSVLLYKELQREADGWNWTFALALEHATANIVAHQSHRGFWFDSKLAESNVKDLDLRMESIRQIVEPLLPPKPLSKTQAAEYVAPKKQFNMNGSMSAVMTRWLEKHGGRVEDGGVWVYGVFHTLPIQSDTPLVSSAPASVRDSTHIKQWLVEMGWEPTQYKERDLTLGAKKVKLSTEKFQQVVKRYVEQTLESPFCKDRCEHLGVQPAKLLEKLLKHKTDKPLKVLTNPTFTVGQDKEIDPSLSRLFDKFPHVKLVTEYLTYSHRRNSILGGGADFDDWSEDEEDFDVKGFLPNVRGDNRIPTPADSCGAATRRMQHRVVANIPRCTSLYGDKMRAMFGVDPSEPVVQLAYDFASLEARIESHYCWRYDAEKEYCESLLLEKPNDVHTKTAKRVAEAIGRAFDRGSAKPVKYACAYGAQPKRVAKTVGCSLELGEKIFHAYWDAARPLAELRDKLTAYWETTGQKKYILGIDGSKINTRSKSALVNSLFQSAGVACAKLVAVLAEEKLRELGLTVDFWLEDWRNKVYTQSLCMYHK